MASLVINKISGLNRHASEIDLPVEVFTEVKNISTTKRPGAGVKSGAYTEVSNDLFGDDLPAGVTWKNAAEMSLTSPENTDIYLLHGQVSGEDHLYVGKYWDGAAFVDGFKKITEAEGIYTSDVGTNDDQLVDSELLSSVDDYYNGWTVVINIAASVQTAAIVDDYVGSTKTLVFKTAAITGATTGDTYYISRWPLRSGAIPEVDDIIRFAGRENAILGITGNAEQWPTQFQVWYGYINRTYGQDPTTFEIDDFYLDVQPLLKPLVTESPPAGRGSALQSTIAGGGSLTDGDWTVYMAYIYDGYQIGALSNGITETAIGSGIFSTLDIVITIPIDTAYRSADGKFYQAYDDAAGSIPTSYSPHLISRRVTGLRIYIKGPSDTDPKFYQEYIIADANTDNNDIALISSTQRLARLAFSITSSPTLGNTYLEDVGQDGEEIRPNFKYGVAIDEHFIVGAVRTKTGERKNNNLMASVVDGSGVATPDNFGASNIINLGFFGAKQITGLKIIGDIATTASPKRRILVATDDDVYILTLVSGSDFGFALDRVGEKEGIVAPDSIVAAEGLIFGVSRNGFRVYTEQGSKIIGDGLKDDFDDLTDPSEAIGVYIKKHRMIIFHFATDSKTYYVNLLSENFEMGELSWAAAMRIFVASRTGTAYALTTGDIFELESGTTQDGTAIVPLLTTKAISARDFFDEQTGSNGSSDAWINPKDGYIRYKSAGSAITLTVTKNGDTETVTFPNLSLPAQTEVQSKHFRFPMGIWARDLKFTFTLSSGQSATNTDFIWEQLKVVADLDRRID